MVSDNDDIRPKVTIVRSKSDAPISEYVGDESSVFAPIHTAEESIAASLTEQCTLSEDESLIDDLVMVEEAYVAKELGVLSKEVGTASIVIGEFDFTRFPLFLDLSLFLRGVAEDHFTPQKSVRDS